MPSDSAVSRSGEPELTAAQLDRSMRLNMLAGFLGMIWMSVPLGMPLPLLMEAVQASGFQLGLLSAAWLLAMLAQVPSAFLVERLPMRKPFWAIISIVHRCLWGVPALLPIVLPQRRDLWPVVIILALALSNVLGQAGTAPWQSWMADLLPPERAGRFWGVRHRVLSVGMSIAALLFGIVLDRFSGGAYPFLGFQIVFAAAAIFGVLDILVHCGVSEPRPVRHDGEGHFWARIAAPLRNPGFLRLTIAMGIWTGAQAMLGYTMGLPGFFSMVYLKEQFGATYAQASWVFIAAAVGGVLWTARIGHWIDLWGGRRVMLLLTGIGPFFMLPWFFLTPAKWHIPFLGHAPVPQAVLLICAASLLAGGFYSATWVCQVRLTQAYTGTAGRTVAMGVHWSLVGLIGACGPLAAGWIKDHVHFDGIRTVIPGGAPLSYFHVLLALHLLLAWAVVWPMFKKLRA